MIRFLSAVTMLFVIFGFMSCDNNSGSQNCEQILAGTWVYECTQMKTNGEWSDFPSVSGSAGEMTFNADGSATISMTFNGQTQSQDFKWELRDNGDYLTNGVLRGKIVFDGDNRFYLNTDETFDPATGENVTGEFRDVYNRK